MAQQRAQNLRNLQCSQWGPRIESFRVTHLLSTYEEPKSTGGLYYHSKIKSCFPLRTPWFLHFFEVLTVHVTIIIVSIITICYYFTFLSITGLLIWREWSGVPVTHPQQIGRLPELSDVLCPQCKSCWAFDELIYTEQYYLTLNRTKMIFMYTMCTTHTCDQLSKKGCVNSKEKLNKFHWTVEDCASDKKCIFVALN